MPILHLTIRTLILRLAVVMGYLVESTKHLNIGIIVDPQLPLEPLSTIVDKMSSIYQEMALKQESKLNLTWVVLHSTDAGNTIRTVCGMVNNGMQGLVSALRCSHRRTVSSVTETFRIPHLSVDLYPCPPGVSEEFTLRLTSQYKYFASVLVDVVKASGWRHVGLSFYHLMDFHKVKESILMQLSFAGIQSVLQNPWTNSNMTEPPANTRIFFMTENINIYNKIDEPTIHSGLSTSGVVVQDMRPCTGNNQPIDKCPTNLIFVNPRPIKLCLMIGVTCTEFRRRLTFPEYRLTQSVMMFQTVSDDIVKGEIYEDSVKAICSAGKQKPFIKGRRILRELKKMCGDRESGYCENFNMPVDYDLYGITAASDGLAIRIGEWSQGTGLSIHKTASKVTSRLFTNKINDFGGVTLRIGVNGDSAPFSNRTDSGNGQYYGLTIDILKDIAKELNFRYTIVEPADYQYGAKLDNESWSGVVGMLIRGEIDLGVGIFSVTTERTEVVEFTTAFMYDSLGIITAKPVETQDMFQIFKPFSLNIWLAVLTAGLIGCVGFAFITSKSPTKIDGSCNGKVVLERSVHENMFLVISSYFEQGPTFYPSSTPARCFLTFWFVYTLLIMTMYTARLAAVLTVSSPLKPIDSLQDLAHQTDLEIYVREGASTWSFFNNSEKPLYRHIASRVVPKKNVNNYLSSIGGGNYCVIGVRSLLEYFAAQNCGKARLASEVFQRFPVAFMTAKQSPFKHAVDNMIQKMVESGVIDSLLRKWVRTPGKCPATNSSGGVEKLGLDSIGGIFLVYGTVTIVGVCVLLVEVCKYRLA